MSSTPRPWKITDVWAPGWKIAATIGNDEHDVAQVRPMENAHLIVRAVNAFEALLAVAKEVAEPIIIAEDEYVCRCCDGRLPKHDPRGCALRALDAAHPGWQEWE